MEPASREYAPLAASEAAESEAAEQPQPASAALASEPMIVVAGYPAKHAKVPNITRKALADIASFFE